MHGDGDDLDRQWRSRFGGPPPIVADADLMRRVLGEYPAAPTPACPAAAALQAAAASGCAELRARRVAAAALMRQASALSCGRIEPLLRRA